MLLIKNKILLLFLILIGLSSCSNDLVCADFKSGTFYTPVQSKIAKKYIIQRKGNSQIEYQEGNKNSSLTYYKLEWYNECNFRAKYDETKIELSKIQKERNNMGGVLFEKIKIKGNCILYRGTGVINGEVVEYDVKLCKER